MWQTLLDTAGALSRESANCVSASYGELLAALSGVKKQFEARPEGYQDGVAVALDTAIGVRDGLSDVVRLISQVDEAQPHGDGEAAPGAILTPKGVAISHSLFKDKGADMQSLSNVRAETLLADLPSLRWSPTSAVLSLAVGTGTIPSRAGIHAGPSQRLVAGRDTVREPHESHSVGALQAEHAALQDDLHARLRELHPDASLVDIHVRLLGEAAAAGSLPPLSDVRWYALMAADPQVVKETRPLLSALFHTSRDSTDAWARIAHAMLHGLAAPGDAVSCLAGRPRGSLGEATDARDGSRWEGWAPESFAAGVQQLRREVEARLREQLGKQELHPEAGAGGAWERELPATEDALQDLAKSTVSFDTLAAYHAAMLPSTHLQVVGQKLLHHAAQQLPGLLALPERPPDWLLCALHVRPFAEALRQEILTTVSVAGTSVRGGKAQQRTEVATAEATASDADAEGPGSPLGQARAVLDQVVCLFRDMEDFETGFAAVIEKSARWGCEAKQRSPATTLCTSVLREEVSRVVRETRPALRSFLCGAVMGAVQACIGPNAPLHPVPVTPETWPVPDAAQGTDQGQQQDGSAPALDLESERCRGGTAYVTEAHVPAATDAASDRVLRFVGHLLDASAQQADALKVLLASAALECLALLMDRLACVCTTLRDMPLGLGPACGPSGSGSGSDSRKAGPHCSASGGSGSTSRSSSATAAGGGGRSDSGTGAGAVGSAGDGGVGAGWAGSSPLPQLLLFHSAACCVARRLEAMRAGLQGATAQDEAHVALLLQHGECLVQADELVTNLHDHILMAYRDVLHSVVLAAVDRVDWCAYRPAVRGVGSGGGAGPAVRLWHSLLVRLAHASSRCASLHTAGLLVGQVLHEGLACLAQRYLCCYPSRPMLPEFLADAVHAAATAFLLCQPMPVDAGGEHCTSGAVAGGIGPSISPSGGPEWRILRVPMVIARGVATISQELLVRAALLHVDGSRLVQLWREAVVAAPAAVPAPPVPSGTSEGTCGHGAESNGEVGISCRPVIGGGGSKGAREEARASPDAAHANTGQSPALTTSLGDATAPPETERPSFSTALPQPPLPEAPLLASGSTARSAALQPQPHPEVPGPSQSPLAPAPQLMRTSADDGGHGASKLEPLPAILSHRARPPSSTSGAAPGPVAEALEAPSSTVTSASPPGVAAAASQNTCGRSNAHAGMSGDDQDAERLALWSSWLPRGIVQALQGPGEAVDLRGPLLPSTHMPLGDRMAEEQPRDAWRQRPRADGRAWRRCLDELACAASREQVLLALACRHELHAALGNEPPEVVESRRGVRALARELGLLISQEGD